MHADEFGVYSLVEVNEVKHGLVHYTLYIREHGYVPEKWGAHVSAFSSFSPTRVPAKTARNLLKLLQRKTK